MLLQAVLVGSVLTLADFAEAPKGSSAADVIELRDGSSLLGQVYEPAPLGGLVVLVRRDWAQANLPAWLKVWQREEVPLVRQARHERKLRLTEWRDELDDGGPLRSWVGREIVKLSTLRVPRTPLMGARLKRADVRSVMRQPIEVGRLLRLGWLAEIDNVETKPVLELKDELDRRKLLRPTDRGRVDGLLPLYPESADRWRTRRAATEVALDPGLRFVQFRDFLIPEAGPNNPPPRTTTELLDSPEGLGGFGSIQAVTPFDAIQERLGDAADQGAVGSIVSRLVFSVDSDRADTESTLWVRQSGGRWSPTFSHKGTATVDEPEDAGPTPAEATPIRSLLLVLEGVAATPSSPEVSERRQEIGATAQRALGRARAALQAELDAYVLSVFAAPQ
jgi:hypothetical protein